MSPTVVDFKPEPDWPNTAYLDSNMAQRLATRARDGTVSDTKVRGFKLRKQGPSVSWVFEYSFRGKKGQRITIGKAVASAGGSGGVVPDYAARAEAQGYRQQIAADIDPKAYQQDKKEQGRIDIEQEQEARNWTLVKALERKKQRDGIRPASVANYTSLFSTCLAPVAEKRMDRMRRQDWLKLLLALKERRVATTKRFEPQQAADYAGRVRALVSALYTVAAEAGIDNPLKTLSREFPMPKNVRQVHVSRDNLATWWNQVRIGFSDQQRRLVLLYLLTGLRDKEARGLRWSEVKQDRIEIPPDRVKTKVVRSIPKTQALDAILRGQKGQHDELVFPSRQAKKTGMMSSLLPLLRDTGTSVHGLRRTFLTELDALGDCPVAVRYALGGHKPQQVSDRNYLVQNFDDCRHHLERVQQRIDGFMDQRTDKQLRDAVKARQGKFMRGYPPEVLRMGRDELRAKAGSRHIWDEV